MIRLIIACAIAALFTCSASAEVYRWIGASGEVCQRAQGYVFAMRCRGHRRLTHYQPRLTERVTGCHGYSDLMECPPPPSGRVIPNWRNYHPGY